MNEKKKKWYRFDKRKGSHQKRPPIKKYVLVLRENETNRIPYVIAVGYRKDGGGDKQSPYFVVPGLGGNVLAWCDCLPDGIDYDYAWVVKP